MSQDQIDEDRYLPYLRYATVDDVWRVGWFAVVVWLALSGISFGFGYLLPFVGNLLSDEQHWGVFKFLPNWLWITSVLGALVWFSKGRTIHFKVPKLGFSFWLFLVLGFGAFLYVTENGPAWLVFPLFFAILSINVSLQMINEDGEKNYRRMINS